MFGFIKLDYYIQKGDFIMKRRLCFVSLFVFVFFAGVIFAEDDKVVDTAVSQRNVQSVDSTESTVTVSSSAICTSIVERMPEGIGNEFLEEVEKIYYWTKIDNAQGQKIKHVWKLGDNVLAEIELNIKSPSYRTWSSKTIYPGLKGKITVSVIDEEGNAIKEENFVIK